MVAKNISGLELGRGVENFLASPIEALLTAGVEPCLAIVQVGDNPASGIYVQRKIKALSRIHLVCRHLFFPSDVDLALLLDTIAMLNGDTTCHGIIVQLPLPDHMDKESILESLHPSKDVDGLTTWNQGLLFQSTKKSLTQGFVPATPLGCLHMVRSTGQLRPGCVATVVGRSALVGKPMAQLLLNEGCTVLHAHSHTTHLGEFTRQADVLVVAAGQPGLVTPDMVKPGAVVVDVGITRLPQGSVVGDVDPAVAMVAGWLSPVPGGVGPMTIAMLLHNLVIATQRAVGFDHKVDHKGESFHL